MSDSVREAFIKWYFFKYAFYPLGGNGDWHTLMDSKMFTSYQAATAAADAEWRGVVEKLVKEARNVQNNQYMTRLQWDALQEALAQAEKLMGRKL